MCYTNGTARSAIQLVKTDRVTIGDMQLIGFNARYSSSADTNTTDAAGAGGSVATDTIWNAAGDLAVGTGSDTATRLGIGAAGGALSVINSAVAWNSGTSFPGTAATGDRYWRTDRRLEYFYDGTRWLTTTLFEGVLKDVLLSNLAATGSATLGYFAPGTSFDIWVENLVTSVFVNGTTNGTNFWTIRLQKSTAGNTQTSIGTVTTASDTGSNWTARETAMNHLVAVGTYKQMQVVAEATLSPGGLFWAVRFTYRLVG